MSQVIQDKLDTVRRKHAAVRAGRGLVWMVGLFVVVLTLTMCVDYLFDLPYAVRAALLALHVSGLLFLFGRFVVWPMIKGPDDETVALMIEAFYTDARSRIISAVQFSRPEAAVLGSPLMIGAAVREAEEYIEPKATGDVIDGGHLLKQAGWALLGVAVAAGLFFWGRPNSDALLQRALCVPGVAVPRSTRVELLTPADRIVAKGDSIQIVARALGTIPSEGTLRVEYSSGATSEFPMPAVKDETEQFAITIDNVQDGFKYRVDLNDGRSDKATVTAHARPEVAGVVIRQHLPAYTKLPPTERSKNDLTLLAGSRMELKVASTKMLKDSVSQEGPRTRVYFDGANVSYFLQRGADGKSAVTRENNQSSIPIPPGTTGMTLHLVDDLGLESKNAATYPISLVPDGVPRIEIVAPQAREELVTERAAAKITYQADDDFGIKSLALKYMPAAADTELQGDGLWAQYFENETLTGNPAVERIDKMVNFDTNDPMIGKQFKDHFSIRWTGKILPRLTGPHVFGGWQDDGVRMYADDQLVFDNFNGKPVDVRSDPITLEAGKMIDVRIEYRDEQATAAFRFSWIRPDNKREIVPTSAMFSSDEAVRAARQSRISTIPLPPPETARSVRGNYDWDLGALRLKPGQIIEWWIEATDFNDQTGPGVGESEHRTIKIGTEAEVREYLLQRLGNPLQEIQDVQERQIEEASKLGEVFRGKKRE